MSTETTTALDGLTEREEAVAEAQERVHQLEAEAHSSRRDLDRAIGPLQSYYRGLESGEVEPDPDREAKLKRAVAEAQASIAPQVTYNPRAEQTEGARVELINPEVEGKLAGARQKLSAAEAELDRYLRARFDDLVVELGTLGVELSERYAPLAEEGRRAQREWVELRERWRPLIALGDLEWGDLPGSPFAEIRDVPALMPQQLSDGASLGAPRRPKKRKRAS